MVRLKDKKLQTQFLAHGIFQFQNGAIKSNTMPVVVNEGDKFQFQNGAIKRRHFSEAVFNQIYFNSKMVRLKALNAEADELQATFQFQNGAIKRFWFLRLPSLLINFNSKMVRLKEIKTAL